MACDNRIFVSKLSLLISIHKNKSLIPLFEKNIVKYIINLVYTNDNKLSLNSKCSCDCNFCQFTSETRELNENISKSQRFLRDYSLEKKREWENVLQELKLNSKNTNILFDKFKSDIGTSQDRSTLISELEGKLLNLRGVKRRLENKYCKMRLEYDKSLRDLLRIKRAYDPVFRMIENKYHMRIGYDVDEIPEILPSYTFDELDIFQEYVSLVKGSMK
jgi:hypothetical protein